MIPELQLSEFLDLAKVSQRVAVFEEISASHLTPDSIYSTLQQCEGEAGVMLEDLYENNHLRYSYLCFESIASLVMNHEDTSDPLAAIRTLQADYACVTRAEVAPLITSSCALIAYEAVRCFEDIPTRHTSDPKIPLAQLTMYALSLRFDHEKKTLLVSYVVSVGIDPQQAYGLARAKIALVIKELASAAEVPLSQCPPFSSVFVEVDTSDAEFIKSVEAAKQHIIQGDAFQIVLSRTYRRAYTVPEFEIYKTLRQVSPAPFLFYFPLKTGCVLGASPERLVRVDNKQITVNPIAGTRRRCPGEKTDAAIAADLLQDEKELAEHRMLVDLARNDVGAVSVAGSVQVAELLKVKHYSHVSHITSTVVGDLDENYDALDALVASFPAGTVTGAPKIRAMQIIDVLETSGRGLYGGAICRFDVAGNLESCIAIRMAHLKQGIATIRAGAGIVHDSNPQAEAQETNQKVQSVLTAIAIAQGE